MKENSKMITVRKTYGVQGIMGLLPQLLLSLLLPLSLFVIVVVVVILLRRDGWGRFI